jgi:Flp pilus assembly protein TadG
MKTRVKGKPGQQRTAARNRAVAVGQKLRGEEGADLLEYAIVCILLLTLLFGIAGFGHMLYAYHFVSSTAREATRWAAVNGSTCSFDGSCAFPSGATDADVQAYVQNHIPLGIDSSKVSAVPTWPPGPYDPTTCATTPNAPGCTVEVQITYSYTFVFPLIRTATLPLSSTSEMIISH